MTTTAPARADSSLVTSRQQQTWASGDYTVIASRIVLVSELLAEAAAVLSVFGSMFIPDPRRTAAEMLRVTRPDGRIAVASSRSRQPLPHNEYHYRLDLTRLP